MTMAVHALSSPMLRKVDGGFGMRAPIPGITLRLYDVKMRTVPYFGPA